MKGGVKIFIIIVVLAIVVFLLFISPETLQGFEKQGKTLITSKKINIWWGVLQNNFYHRWQDSMTELHNDKTLKSIQRILSQKVLQKIKDSSQKKLQSL